MLRKICLLLAFVLSGTDSGADSVNPPDATATSRNFVTDWDLAEQLSRQTFRDNAAFRKAGRYADLPMRSRVAIPKPDIPNGRTVTGRAHPPDGYREIFRTDFSNTSLSAEPIGNQWWYVPHGGEFGYAWDRLPAHVTKLQFQTLVHRQMDLQDYIHADICDIGGHFGNVLRYVNVQNDWVDPPRSASRNQLMVKLDGTIKKLFVSLDVLVPLTNQANISEGEHWYMLYEFHNNGPYRTNFRIIYKPDADRFVYSLQCLYDQTREERRTEWVVESREVAEWGRWTHFDMQTETRGNGSDGIWKVWLDGDLLYEMRDVIIGFPINNVFPLKQYTGRKTMVGSENLLTVYFDNLEIYTSE